MRFSVFCGLLLTPFLLFAQSKTPVFESALVIPWTFLDQTVRNSSLQDSEGLQRFHYTTNALTLEAQDVPISISQASIDLGISLKPLIVTQNVTTWESERLKLEVHVSGFKIEKAIQRVVNGVQVIVHLKAECGPFSISQNQAHTTLSWTWRTVGSRLQAFLTNLDLNWAPHSWLVSDLKCQGPQGFSDLVQIELQKNLSDASAIKPFIKTTLEQNLNQKIEQTLAPWHRPQWIFKNNGKGLQLRMTPSETLLDQGLVFRLLLQTSDNPGEIVPLGGDSNLWNQISDSPTLIFSRQALTSLAQALSVIPQVQAKLNDFAPFQKLLNSRFLQFFIWPDLMKYSKRSIFQLTSHLKQQAQINLEGVGDNSIEGSSQGLLESFVTSERDGKNWNYLYLRTQFTGNFQLQLNQGELTFQFLTADLNSDATFYPDYIKTYEPVRRIASQRVDTALSHLLKAQKIKMNFPQIEMGNSLILQAERLERPTPEHFFIKWETLSNP